MFKIALSFQLEDYIVFGEWLILLGCLEMVEWSVARKKDKVPCGVTSSYCFLKKVENTLDMFDVPLAKIR